MLRSPFKFLGFNNAKTPKSSPHNDRNTNGKLRKVRHPANTTVDTPNRPSGREFEVDTPVVSERKESGEHYQNQPTGLLLIGQETAAGPPDIHSIDATRTFSPHTQVHETNHLSPSSSIFEDQSRDSSEGGKKPRVQAPVSGDPNRLWTSIPSVHRGPFGGGNSLTHEWDGDHGGMQDWVNSGPDYIPKRLMAPERLPFDVDPHQHDAQEQHEAKNDNLKKASQQQNNEIYSPIVTRANPLEEDENRARGENVSKHDHRERSKAAGYGDPVKDSFEPEIYYYIVPAGLDIIFQDEDGTEITRVGKIKGTQEHPSQTHTKNIPIVVQDIFGNELFRSSDQGSLDDPNLGTVDAMAGDNFVGLLPSPNQTAWKTIIVDEKGNQIALKYAERNVGRSTSSFPT